MASILNTHIDDTSRARAAAAHVAATWNVDVSEHDVDIDPANGHALVGVATAEQLVVTVVAANDHGSTELAVTVVNLTDIVGAHQAMDCRWYVTTADGYTVAVPRRIGATIGARTRLLLHA